ncbi:MAG: hypothetical protein AAGH15_02750 [Myxococcota bacterium]
MTRWARSFRRIARQLGSVELMATSMESSPTEDDFNLWDGPRDTERFLDFYGDKGIALAMERYGFLAAAKRRGFHDVSFHTRADDDRHTLLVEGAHEALAERARLMEMAVRRDRVVANGEQWDVLTVDWLLLQNPAASFRPERPRLPGQTHPGLGVGERALEIVYRVAKRLHLDGVLTTGEYFHNAALYRRELAFFDGAAEGTQRALEALLFEREGLDLGQASWAIEWGFVRDTRADDGIFRWEGLAQVRAMRPSLAAVLEDPERERLAGRIHAELERNAVLRLDREAFEARWDAERMHLLAPPRDDRTEA